MFKDPAALRTNKTVLIISDALGNTAYGVARAAIGQFDPDAARTVRLQNIREVAQVEERLAQLFAEGSEVVVLHTIADISLRAAVASYLHDQGILAEDLLGPSVNLVSSLTGLEPLGVPGMTHKVDERYFDRIEAMEYFVEHDDGRGADDLSRAEIVLLGISRTGKTPLSMYLAFQGYRVSNIPLMHGVEPPASIFELDPAKLFGLISTASVVAPIRATRMGEELERGWAGSYASPEYVTSEMEEAHDLMRRLGCFIVRTDHRAIEETASEIASRLEMVAAARARRNMT